MIKDIIVNLGVGQRKGSAGDYAVSVANALKAHITAIAFAYDPLDLVSRLGYVATEVSGATTEVRRRLCSIAFWRLPRERVSLPSC